MSPPAAPVSSNQHRRRTWTPRRSVRAAVDRACATDPYPDKARAPPARCRPGTQGRCEAAQRELWNKLRFSMVMLRRNCRAKIPLSSWLALRCGPAPRPRKRCKDPSEGRWAVVGGAGASAAAIRARLCAQQPLSSAITTVRHCPLPLGNSPFTGPRATCTSGGSRRQATGWCADGRRFYRPDEQLRSRGAAALSARGRRACSGRRDAENIRAPRR